MNNTLISVIVPIYKVEKYLEKCVRSISGQTYQNLEIILVDDGSPDQCGELCEEFATQDPRIVVIHKENGGLSDARNAGIDVAKGEYFVFVDSDDYIHPEMIAQLWSGISQFQADISVCDFQSVKEDARVSAEAVPEQGWKIAETNEEKLSFALGEQTTTIFTVAWNKMYARRLFDSVRYPFGKIHEDEFTTYKTIHDAKRIAYLPFPLYYYVQREGSIMANGFDQRNLSVLEAYGERLGRYREKGMFDWYERVLFLYRLFLMRFEKNIKDTTNGSNKWLDPYYEIYRKEVLRSVRKIPCGRKQQIGYLYSALMPKKYYEKRYCK